MPGECWSVDIMTYDGMDFLIAVDKVTSFAWIARLYKKGAKQVTEQLRKWASMWGVPSLLKSDGATCFTASIFNYFCQKYGIYHVLTSAYNPESNGSSERMVH